MCKINLNSFVCVKVQILTGIFTMQNVAVDNMNFTADTLSNIGIIFLYDNFKIYYNVVNGNISLCKF